MSIFNITRVKCALPMGAHQGTGARLTDPHYLSPRYFPRVKFKEENLHPLMIRVVKSTIRATTRSQMAIVSSAFSSDCANINARVALVSDRQS